MRFAILAVFLTGCGAVLHQGVIETRDGRTVERVTNDPGGHVRTEFRLWAERRQRHGIEAYVIDGECASWCVFEVLAAEGTCYTPQARLWAHPVSIGAAVTTEATRALTDRMVAAWPGPMQRWWHRTQPTTLLGATLEYDDLRRLWPAGECEVKA